MNENKIPCGGFRLGDGLTMEGDTLKSLGGAYVKVKANINDGEQTFEFMDDSPLKTFEEIVQKAETSPVTLQAYAPGSAATIFDFNGLSDSVLVFFSLAVSDYELNVTKIFIGSDNKITFSVSAYTLTPTT